MRYCEVATHGYGDCCLRGTCRTSPPEPGRVSSCPECGEEHASDLSVQHNDLVAIMAALGISDYARPYSSHAVVHREVLPAIKQLRHDREHPYGD